jgi:hypothetical protein
MTYNKPYQYRSDHSREPELAVSQVDPPEGDAREVGPLEVGVPEGVITEVDLSEVDIAEVGVRTDVALVDGRVIWQTHVIGTRY